MKNTQNYFYVLREARLQKPSVLLLLLLILLFKEY